VRRPTFERKKAAMTATSITIDNWNGSVRRD
jgi:hypothetical protein